jgi:hypothetical protein
MKKALVLCLVFFGLTACQPNANEDEFEKINWNQRAASFSDVDSLETGKSYLSIYSQIYSLSQHKKYNLTVMVSLRNTSEIDTIFISKAKYFDTHGKLVKTYVAKPVYISPMETLEIVINEADISGGTGSNFIFDWKTPKDCPEPIFEAVMSSTVGSQGLSFTTEAKRID